MSAKGFAKQFKEIVEDAKKKGTDEIKVDNLIAYLDAVLASPERDPTELHLERYRNQLQERLEHYRASENNRLELFRSVITAGQGAIRSSMLLNGGASVALLAFIGHLVQFRVGLVSDFAVALLWFSLGVLAIAVTSGATYLSQWLYGAGSEIARKVGFGVNLLCIALGFSSYALFVVGLFVTYTQFRALS